MAPILIDLSPLTRPQQAVYRLWTQRLLKVFHEEGSIGFYKDAVPILVFLALKFSERADLSQEEAIAIAHRLVDFELGVQRLLRVQTGMPS